MPADGVRGHRSSAGRAAREQRTGPRMSWRRPSARALMPRAARAARELIRGHRSRAAREQRTGPRMGCGKGRGMPFLVENAFQFHTPHRSLSRPARNPRTLDAVHAVLGAGRAPPALAALGADAVELHAVASHHEAEEATDAVLEALQLLALALDQLEARLAVVEVALGGEPDLLE